MRKVSVSSTLTVFHDDQFWVGVVERNENGRLAVSKNPFGAEPSNEKVHRFVVEKCRATTVAQRPEIRTEKSQAKAKEKREMKPESCGSYCIRNASGRQLYCSSILGECISVKY